MKPSCKTCRFYGGDISRNGHIRGECRKDTPRLDRDGAAAWPIVRPGDWCGEFQPAAHPPDKIESVTR